MQFNETKEVQIIYQIISTEGTVNTEMGIVILVYEQLEN